MEEYLLSYAKTVEKMVCLMVTHCVLVINSFNFKYRVITKNFLCIPRLNII